MPSKFPKRFNFFWKNIISESLIENQIFKPIWKIYDLIWYLKLNKPIMS